MSAPSAAHSSVFLGALLLWPLFAGFPRLAFILTKKVAVPATILFRSISESMTVVRISASGAPANVAFPPSPMSHQSTSCLPSTMTDCHTTWRYSNGSSFGVSRSASKNATNSGRFDLEPSSSCPVLLLFLSSSQVIKSCSQFALFVWTITCCYLPFNRTWCSSFSLDTTAAFFKALGPTIDFVKKSNYCSRLYSLCADPCMY